MKHSISKEALCEQQSDEITQQRQPYKNVCIQDLVKNAIFPRLKTFLHCTKYVLEKATLLVATLLQIVQLPILHKYFFV